ncbi:MULTISPECIES: hypothetical protein [unclassified Mycobacterium]|uniref:hypothetical protein n=1 Tax=unclassified Mycobacterium TaxID=2642494 RepID=UPI0007FFEA5D|nr:MULTISPECIES: hypothetical protein [unclassified Mycobacterium]OBH04951.1 hypothetical protein A5696_03355 [Mycobacterium sp. E2699]OBI51119.1 hypothetical protein A5705_09915 [Mycobacterium sp. E787]
MYLSAERLALANQTVKETFEQCSVAWQAIPHWDTRDPSKTQVPNDNVATPAILTLATTPVSFNVTLAEVIAPTPDVLLASVIANTVTLAATVDKAVFIALSTGGAPPAQINSPGATGDILNGLLDARVLVEQGGYRAPSCLITNTPGLKQLTALTTAAIPATDVLLAPANINCLQRVDQLENPVPNKKAIVAYLLGRRRRIAPAGAAEASPGEEALDLAVSIPPSLEIVGEVPATANSIQFNVRIGYALRIKDVNGYVVIRNQ